MVCLDSRSVNVWTPWRWRFQCYRCYLPGGSPSAAGTVAPGKRWEGLVLLVTEIMEPFPRALWKIIVKITIIIYHNIIFWILNCVRLRNHLPRIQMQHMVPPAPEIWWCLLPLRYGDECPSILCSRTSERILWVKPNITRSNICMVSRCLQYDLLNTPDPNLPWICCTCIGHGYLHLHRHGLLHHWRQRLLFRSCNLRRLGGSRRCLFEAWLLGRRPCCDMCGSSMDHCWFERNYPCPNNKWLEPSHISYTIPEQISPGLLYCRTNSLFQDSKYAQCTSLLWCYCFLERLRVKVRYNLLGWQYSYIGRPSVASTHAEKVSDLLLSHKLEGIPLCCNSALWTMDMCQGFRTHNA